MIDALSGSGTPSRGSSPAPGSSKPPAVVSTPRSIPAPAPPGRTGSAPAKAPAAVGAEGAVVKGGAETPGVVLIGLGSALFELLKPFGEVIVEAAKQVGAGGACVVLGLGCLGCLCGWGWTGWAGCGPSNHALLGSVG